jgi:hypothetical protein
MDEDARRAAEAAAFRRLVAHLQANPEVQNLDLMTLAGFCRNCLARWYGEAAAEAGHPLTVSEARRTIYGMDHTEWKTRYQKDEPR